MAPSSVAARRNLRRAAPADAQISGDVIRIGFITDLSGTYADIDGPAGADAIRMAIADMGGAINGKKIELLVADHQNKPDVAASKAREWFDTQGLDMLIAGTNSGTNLAMAKVAAEKKKPMISIGGGTSAADQRAVLAVDHPLRIRHRGARAGDRFADRQERRQELVFPDRRLRVRRGARARRDRSHQGQRRHGPRRSVRHPLGGVGLLVVPAAGAGVEGTDPRTSRTPVATRSIRSRPRRNSASTRP